MSCEKCTESLQIDGIDPPCWNQGLGFGVQGSGFNSEPETLNLELDSRRPGIDACWIPPLDEAGSRIMEIRNKLITIGELVGRETIMKLYEVTKEDLVLLDFVDAELKPADPAP